VCLTKHIFVEERNEVKGDKDKIGRYLERERCGVRS
jgi:hypothetical protein